jgi:hypothetical protein
LRDRDGGEIEAAWCSFNELVSQYNQGVECLANFDPKSLKISASVWLEPTVRTQPAILFPRVQADSL